MKATFKDWHILRAILSSPVHATRNYQTSIDESSHRMPCGSNRNHDENGVNR